MRSEDLLAGYYCPFCGSNHFQIVTVCSPKTGLPKAVEGLYQCAGCTVVFTDPESFVQLTRDSLTDRPHYRERRPTREYPPDAVTAYRSKKDAD